ncbi:MAG: arginine--tRNA ligase [Candidatus Magasanikbacteria bacterium]
MKNIKKEIEKILRKVGVTTEVELSSPPKPEMGDLAFGCFGIAKELGKNPAEMATEIVQKIERLKGCKIIDEVKAFGPYVNFYLNAQELAKVVLQDEEVGKNNLGNGKRVMVEFAHPNTHKAFHIGHLRNITTGESVVRILENAQYDVVRANYQGDVGMHIAKCLYGILQTQNSKLKTQNFDKLKTINEKVEFLGKAYAAGSKAFEESEDAKKEIVEINEKIYSHDSSIKETYETTREWSLEYFDNIYKRVGSHFDRLYFESETFARGVEIVHKHLKTGVFKESEGAIIFEGSKHGLHDRVFINSKGFPTYEAKDLALAELQFKEYKPEAIYHVVAREQSEYFKVMFRALESTLPESKGKEHHMVYGWVSLKDGKMSSRLGNVVLGEALIDEVKNHIKEIMGESKVKDKEEVAEKVAIGAIKYAFLKTGVSNDIQFDMKESISTTGDSGPYLLYIVARIKSILRKNQDTRNKKFKISNLKSLDPDSGFQIFDVEKKLLMRLGRFDETTELAAEELDPSKIAQYLFSLAQDFNTFYHDCPVLQAEETVRNFRLSLIQTVEKVMTRGLYLLGIETVEEM